jgi:RNA-directed DNA polymerase
MQAFKLIKANAGGAGVDEQSLAAFEENLKNNLYKIWNRMSSGTYFPPPVKAVPIPKKSGGVRILGVPTVADRIAQMVVKLTFEPCIEPLFHEDSYAYRPNKSALDALSVTRQRCWRYEWVLEYDIIGLFDNLDHDLMMKAVKKHTRCKWVILYIERWLKTPMQLSDGILQVKTKGVMQGGVISPLLSNLFLHYVFDFWMAKHYPDVEWCRYADDGLLHCNTQYKARHLHAVLIQRFKECGLELHPDKTKIVYCKEKLRKGCYPNTQFDFLGYSFRKRWVKNMKDNSLFMSFTPAVSKSSLNTMRDKIRERRFSKRTEMSIEQIADEFNPVLRGWINYYGRFNFTGLYPMFRYFNSILLRWARRKFKNAKGRVKAAGIIRMIRKDRPLLFAHWKFSMGGFVA